MLNVGDKVRVKKWNEMVKMENATEETDYKYGDYIAFDECFSTFCSEMIGLSGKIFTIDRVFKDGEFSLLEDKFGYTLNENMVEKI